MKKIDISFSTESIEILKNWVGKNLDCIKCDPFIFSTSVYGIVGIQADSEWFALTNFVEVLDYFGNNEDVGVLKLTGTNAEFIHSFTGESMILLPIHAKIIEINLVNENQQLFKSSSQIYDVWVTRGIIIKLDNGREISFEKDVWLSEDIIVEKGYDLYKKFAPTDAFLEDWKYGYTAKCNREIVTIN